MALNCQGRIHPCARAGHGAAERGEPAEWRDGGLRVHAGPAGRAGAGGLERPGWGLGWDPDAARAAPVPRGAGGRQLRECEVFGCTSAAETMTRSRRTLQARPLTRRLTTYSR